MAITDFFASALQCEDLVDDEHNAERLLHEFIEQLLCVIAEKNIAVDAIECLLERALYLQKKLNNVGAFKSGYVSDLMAQEDLDVLCILYPYVDDDTKTSISALAQREEWDFTMLPDRPTMNTRDLDLSDLTASERLADIYRRDRLGLFCRLLSAKILQPNKEVEEQLLAVLPKVRDDREATSPSSYDYIFSCITDAYLADGFIEKERIRECIRKTNIAELIWVVDWECYDYSHFQCEWLAYCSEKLLQTMGGNEKVRGWIQKAVQEQYLNGKIKKNILKIYFNYFVG